MNEKNTNPQDAAAEPRKQHKRRIVLINPGLQFKIALVSLALFGMAAFSVWWETYQTINTLAGSGILESTTGSISAILTRLNHTIILKMVLFLGLVWVLAIALSHYIAGPLFRLQASLRTISTGDFTHRIWFRKFDQLQSVADEFNAAISALQMLAQKEKKAAQDLARRLDDLAPRLDKSSAEEIARISSEFKGMGSSFKT